MSLIAIAMTVLAMLLVGLVLFSALCRLVGHTPDFFPRPRDLLFLGPLPGLSLVTTLVTFLALLHLLRAWILIPLAIAILVALRRDTLIVWKAFADAAVATIAATRGGNLFPLAGIAFGLLVTYVGLFLCFLPASNVDVWVYHLPLAQSIASHAGFVHPQIDNLFYGSQPMALEMLHGAGMVLFDHFAIASAINLAIYMGLLLLVLSFALHARAFVFLIICFFFVQRLTGFFDSTSPMIDTPRACLSIAALLFAYRYACNFRRLDLVLSALMAGFAVAAKTTELVTPLMICITLAPLIWRRGTWRDLFPAAAIFSAISAYWYVKNLILYGNPVYPFLFAHPGLSDEWMRDYMRDLTRPFDIADRAYSTNLLTVRGWQDFATVLRTKFLWLRWPAVVAVLGLTLPLPRRWMLPLWSAILFIIWYVMMFNSTRWAVTAVMLLTVCAVLVLSFIVSAVVSVWQEEGTGALVRWTSPLRRHGLWRHIPVVASAVFATFLLFVVARVEQGKGHSFTPAWMDRKLVVALTRSGDPDEYLKDTRDGYEIYRYIGQHELRQVFQPYDNGGANYVSAYNNGKPNRWILHYRTMPHRIEDADAFVARHHIRYFIQSLRLAPVQVERLGSEHVALANRIITDLKPHSRLLIADRFGNNLYEIQPQIQNHSRGR